MNVNRIIIPDYKAIYLQWKGTGEFINTRFFCRVCSMLHYPKVKADKIYKFYCLYGLKETKLNHQKTWTVSVQ